MKKRPSFGGLGGRIRALVRHRSQPPPAEFHVPISPTEHFFTMVHYLVASLRARGAPLSSCPIIVTVGEDCEPYDLVAKNPWSSRYPLQWVWLDRALFKSKGIFATATSRFCRPFASPIVVMLDADLLVVGSLADLFEQITASGALCGLVAHGSPFLWTTTARGRTNAAWWGDLYRRAGLGTPQFVCQHPGWQIMFTDESYRYAPPYFNLGVLAAPADVMRRIGDRIYQEMELVDGVLYTFFKCQIGLTLAIERLRLPWKALDVRFNFPNLPSFWNGFPQAAQDLRILHYLGEADGFRKVIDMADVAHVRRFLERSGLPPVNARLQSELRVLQPVVDEEGRGDRRHRTARAAQGDAHADRAIDPRERGEDTNRAEISRTVNRPVAIVVLGMHRSGTSALTGCLDLLGVSLGAPLMPANYDNERGYFELAEVVTIHDELLGSFGASALDLTSLPADWASQPAARAVQERLCAVLRRNFDGKPLWGVKDPRLCVLLPLWEPLLRDLNVDPRYLLMLRSPWEVAKSLEARNGLENWESLDLWVEHVAAAERGSRALPRAVTTFDQFLADPGKELSYLAGCLRIAWPRVLDDPVRAELHAFLEPSIRHWRKVEPPKDIDREIVSAAEDLHSSLMALRDGASTALSTRIDAAYSTCARLLAARRASAARISTSEEEYGLRWLRADVSERMEPGQRLFIEGAFVHEGAHPLSKRVLSISYHWIDARDSSTVVVWDGLRTPVKRVLLPGEIYEARISIKAPSQPGKYLLLLDVVREGVAWFSGRQVPPYRAEVLVVAAHDDSPLHRA